MTKMIALDELKRFCAACCEKEGMPSELAQITAEVLAETDCYGTHSHGVKNLFGYIKKKRKGGMSFVNEPVVVQQGPGFALLDAQAGMGMVATYKAMEMAMEKAKACGIGLVTVRNSTHFGAAGFYANMAAKNGMFGMAMSNVDPNMTIPGAKGMILGNNPLAYGSPTADGKSMFLDIAMSNVASLKVVQARKDGTSIPNTWIVDKDGLPTTDPSHYPEEGAMQPFGAHKGYGLAVMIELLTGVLSGGAIGSLGEIKSWCFDQESTNNVCHTCIAVDVDQFCGAESFKNRSQDLAGALRGTDKAKGCDTIFTPGEMEWNRYEKRETGVSLPEAVWGELEAMSADLGLPVAFL